MGFEFNFFKKADEVPPKMKVGSKGREFLDSTHMAVPEFNGSEPMTEDQIAIKKRISAKEQDLRDLGDVDDKWTNEIRAGLLTDIDRLKEQLKPKIY